MKILQVCRQYYPCVGGVERFVADLSARLIARGHTVQVATLDRCWHGGSKLPAGETVNGVPVHRLPFVGGALFFAAPAILRLVKDFDLVHVHNTDFFLDYLSLTGFTHGRPLVVSTHGGFFHTDDHAKIKRVYFN
ncbi:MAG: glycosyltransferase, partial [Chloroflexota bacterium]